MKSLALAYDIFRGENNLEQSSKRKLVIMVSSIKVMLENKLRLKIFTNYNWEYTSLCKDNFLKVTDEISNLTNLMIFKNNEGIKVLNKLKDSDFEKLINIVNSVVDSDNIMKFCYDIRSTAGIDGKIYDDTTPERITEIAIKIINPKKNDIVNDYFNGESGTELALMKHLDLGIDNGYKLNYYGQEINETNYAIGELINFLITGSKEKISYNDSLLSPRLNENNEIMTYDVNISAPEFMMKINDEVIEKGVLCGLFKYGTCANSDWIIASQMINTLNDNGKAAILLPMGALFRSGAEERIRKSIISNDLIDAIIRIPSGVLPNTSIISCWVIFNKNKEDIRKNKIQFIDATDFIESIDRRNNTISELGVNKIVEAYKKFEENKISFILDTSKLQEKGYNLNAFDYIENEKLLESISDKKMIELSKVAQIRRGVQVNKGKLDTLNTGDKKTHYLISIGNIIDGKIIVNEADKIQIDRKWQGVYEVNKGDLLVTSKGTQFKVAIVKEDIKAIVSANLFIIRPYEDKYMPEVLKYYFESKIGQKLIQGIIKGTSIKSIAHKDIEKLLVPEIDIKIQREASEKIEKSNKDYKNRLKEASIIYEKEKEEINKLINFNM